MGRSVTGSGFPEISVVGSEAKALFTLRTEIEERPMSPDTPSEYDLITSGVELPDSPRPVSQKDIKARRRAIREGRLISIPRDELPEHRDPNADAREVVTMGTTEVKDGKLVTDLTYQGQTSSVETSIPDGASAQDMEVTHLQTVEERMRQMVGRGGE